MNEDFITDVFRDAILKAFDEAGHPRPSLGMVDLIIGVASDCYNLGYKAGVKSEKLAHEDWNLGVEE